VSELDLPPELAERYSVVRPIAGGAFGWVYEATQIRLNRRVALKLLHTERLLDPAHVKRFLAEAKLTAGLAHPHIVRILDHDVTGGVPWIAYELLTGGTLDDCVKQGPMEWPRALLAVAQVASALECAHAGGVLHRDIKSKNVMSAGNGHWKVADFGLAKFDSSATLLTAEGAIVGSPVYMAPELCRGEPATPASDIYAVGVLLYELLVGEWPFSAPTPLAVLRMQATVPPPRPGARREGLPAAVDELVLRLLSKDPGARPASAGELRQLLDALMPEDSRSQLARLAALDATAETPVPRRRRSGEASDPHGHRPSITAVAVVLGAAALGYSVGASGRPPPAASARPSLGAPRAPAGLPDAVRATLLAEGRAVRADLDTVQPAFAWLYERVGDLNAMLVLSPSHLDGVRRTLRDRKDRFRVLGDRAARALSAAQAGLGLYRDAGAADLFAACSVASVHAACGLEHGRTITLAGLLESKLARTRAEGMDARGIDLDNLVCYAEAARTAIERHAELVGTLCRNATATGATPPADWPAALGDVLWLGSYFEIHGICERGRADDVRHFAAAAVAPLEGREDARAVALRELLADLWYLGATVEPETIPLRAKRALRVINRLEADQPDCSRAWRQLEELVTRRLDAAGSGRKVRKP
jgi:hypothetical protein